MDVNSPASADEKQLKCEKVRFLLEVSEITHQDELFLIFKSEHFLRVYKVNKWSDLFWRYCDANFKLQRLIGINVGNRSISNKINLIIPEVYRDSFPIKNTDPGDTHLDISLGLSPQIFDLMAFYYYFFFLAVIKIEQKKKTKKKRQEKQKALCK